MGGRGCGLLGRLPQSLGAHNDALAVGRDDQHIVEGGGRSLHLLVERAHVGGGTAGELLQLALPQALAGRPQDGGLRLLEAAPGRLDGATLPQPVGVPLGRQVERGVVQVEVLRLLRPVGEASDRDLPEDRLQAATLTCLHSVVGHTIAVDHSIGACLARGAQVEVILQKLTDQLPAGGLEADLEFLVRAAGRLRTTQEVDQTDIAGVRGGERLGQFRCFSWRISVSSPALPSVSSLWRAAR